MAPRFRSSKLSSYSLAWSLVRNLAWQLAVLYGSFNHFDAEALRLKLFWQ